MRLTLRTMLAYLDDILEPDDTEDIGKKIEESEFATNLVHRTRDCMRRLRLGVPPLIGRGLAADPNSVAEYLDNTLAPERVGEFEKICLESDVHLAEVASCHQILTLVLGEPAEIDPESRRRVYRLAAEADAPPVQTDALRPTPSSSGSGAPAKSARSPRAKPEVPEYLRESPSRLWPIAAMVLVAATLTFGALVALGPAHLRERMTAMVFGTGTTAEEETDAEESPQALVDATLVDAESVDTAPIDAAAPEAGDDAATTPAPVADPSGSEPLAAETDRPVAVEAESPAASASPTRARADSATEVTNQPPAPAADASQPPGDDPKPSSEETPPAENKPVTAPEAGLAPDEPAAGEATRERPEVPETFGRFTSKRDILLKYDEDSGSWIRLAAMSPLAKGDRLLSLPLFRPMIATSTSVTIQAEGPSLVEMVDWTDQEVPVLAVEYGRLLMATVGKPGNSLQFKFGDRLILLTFADADATLALEVRRVLPPGKDPEAEPAPLAVDLYVTSGLVQVRDGDKSFELQAPAMRALVSAGPQSPASDEIPKWVNSEALTDSERLATTTLEPLLPPGEAAALAVKELADSQHQIGKRREVRALATRSLVYLGDFNPCVAALNDPKEKLSWSVYMEELRAAVARSSETAAQVRATFEKQRGADAAFLYRMLWGYSATDLKNGADSDLVDGLDRQDSLDFRVMSLWNLQHTTGSGNRGYRPEDLASKRRVPYNAWKEQLRQKKIVPRAPAASTRGRTSAARDG